MGLDITATARLIAAPCDKRDDCNHVQLYVHEDFPGRSAPFDSGCYTTDDADPVEFRAGSYSGYNEWRAELSRLALGVEPRDVWDNVSKYADAPFVELIHFSDCEGVIGTVASQKLAKDFAAFDEKARKEMDEYAYSRYANWRRAFERASDRGAVEFH